MECSADVPADIFLTNPGRPKHAKKRSFPPRHDEKAGRGPLRLGLPPLRWTETRPPIVTPRKAPDGITLDECDRFAAVAAAFMPLDMALFAVTVAAHDLQAGDVRRVVDEFIRHLETEQRRAGAERRYWALVWHAKPAPHVHMVVAMPRRSAKRRMKRLQARKSFTRFDRESGGRCIKFEAIYDMAGWVAYCLSEMTTQAKRSGRHGKHRPNGPSYLQGGGDRVRLSADAAADAIEMGWVRPWVATNAKRAATRKARTVKPKPVTVETYGGLLFDLPASAAPERPKAAPKHRAKLAERIVGQGSLALRSDNVEILDVLRKLGRTDAERAAVIGRSRAQVTNILNGQFGASREVAQRIVTEAKARGLAA